MMCGHFFMSTSIPVCSWFVGICCTEICETERKRLFWEANLLLDIWPTVTLISVCLCACVSVCVCVRMDLVKLQELRAYRKALYHGKIRRRVSGRRHKQRRPNDSCHIKWIWAVWRVLLCAGSKHFMLMYNPGKYYKCRNVQTALVKYKESLFYKIVEYRTCCILFSCIQLNSKIYSCFFIIILINAHTISDLCHQKTLRTSFSDLSIY